MRQTFDGDWRRVLRRKIGWLLLAKLLALWLLWALFFSPAHRVPMNDAVVSERLFRGEP